MKEGFYKKVEPAFLKDLIGGFKCFGGNCACGASVLPSVDADDQPIGGRARDDPTREQVNSL